jgi:3-oxoadipate enol-lactonase
MTMHEWRVVELPGRGSTYACDIAGPSKRAPVVVLLHGWLATGALNWGPSIEPLSRHFRVIVIDHRGHGRGLRGDEPFSLEHCADDVVALTDVLGVKRFVAVGYSMGGPIAQLVWRRHPERVDGLVLCSTFADLQVGPLHRLVLSTFDRSADGLGNAARLIPSPLRGQLLDAVLGRLPGTSARDWVAELRAHDPRAIREAAHAIGDFSSTEWLGEIAVPTVVVVTERDRVVPPARQHLLAAGIRDARTMTLDADHGVCVTQPDAFTNAVLDATQLVAEHTLPRATRWRRRLASLFAAPNPEAPELDTVAA